MRERWRANQPLVCPLCNSANETIHHLHTCSTSQLGASLIVQRHPDRNLLSTLLQIDEGDLDFTGNCPPDQRLVKLIFSLSVWRTRRYFLQPVFLPTTPRRAGRRIANYFLRLYQSILHKKRRKKRDKSAEKKKFLEELSKVPRQALIAFTDGSSLGNPGPSGAGFYLLTRRTPFSKHLFFSKHTPHSTNNKEELRALTEALTFIESKLSNSRISQPPPVHIFVDNQLAIKATLGLSRPRTNLQLVQGSRRAYARLSRRTRTHIGWVPGHAKIFYNEVADFMARRGAAGRTSRSPPPPGKIVDSHGSMRQYSVRHETSKQT